VGLVVGSPDTTLQTTLLQSRKPSVMPGQTLKRRFKHGKVLQHLTTALKYRRTKAGCEESIQAALDAALAEDKSYIEREWWDTRELWAMYARQHSPLLLQSLDDQPC
jgi:hypothetical protein